MTQGVPEVHGPCARAWHVRWQMTVTSLRIGETAKGDVAVVSKEHQKVTGPGSEEKGRVTDL